ncbi:MAG: hypothetical protein GQ535_03875 [Rhodobacteraceae bacterium]|nr:hypothetical protein [Paracoccaceae bacterium]
MTKTQPEFYKAAPYGIWRNRSANGAFEILTSPDFIQLKLADYYENIATRFGRDFKHIRYISRYQPLFHDGTRHREIRKMAATYLRDVASELEDFEAQSVALIVTKLSQPGRVELVSEVVVPIMQKIAYSMTGLDFYPGLIAILSGTNSLKATKKIDETFGKIFELSKQRFPEDDEDKTAMRVLFAALGSEPMGATFALSFDTLFSGVKRQPISGLPWEYTFPATGPGMAFRQCRHAPVNLGEGAQDVSVIDVDISRFLKDDGANRNHMFGIGAHACLGRGLSLSLWQKVVDNMRTNPMKITHISSSQPTHKVFDYPSEIHVEISE